MRFQNLEAMKQMGEYSFICVPIKKGNKVVGALSADRPYKGEASLQKGEKIMSLVATRLSLKISLKTILDQTTGFPATLNLTQYGFPS